MVEDRSRRTEKARLLRTVTSLRDEAQRIQRHIQFLELEYERQFEEAIPGTVKLRYDRPINTLESILAAHGGELSFLQITAELRKLGVRFAEKDLKKSLKLACTKGDRISWVTRGKDELRVIANEDRFALRKR